MKCSMKDCPRVAWYQVSTRGYCGDHKGEAWKAAAKEGGTNNRYTIDDYQNEKKFAWYGAADRGNTLR